MKYEEYGCFDIDKAQEIDNTNYQKKYNNKLFNNLINFDNKELLRV